MSAEEIRIEVVSTAIHLGTRLIEKKQRNRCSIKLIFNPYW